MSAGHALFLARCALPSVESSARAGKPRLRGPSFYADEGMGRHSQDAMVLAPKVALIGHARGAGGSAAGPGARAITGGGPARSCGLSHRMNDRTEITQ